MLNQLNIQAENPVAVLDQKEAKKFLTKPPARDGRVGRPSQQTLDFTQSSE